MQRGPVVLLRAASLALAATVLYAEGCIAAERIFTAGPILMRPTPCLIAVKSGKKGPDCEPPPLPEHANVDQSVAVRLARALYFVDIQDLGAALDEVDAALRLDPSSVAAHHLSARIALQPPGDRSRFERDIAVARERAPDDPDVQATYAYVLETQNSQYLALRELDEILVKHPDHLYSRMARGRIRMQTCCREDALADFDVVVRQVPDDVGARVARADALFAIGAVKRAIADLTATLEQRPDDFMIRTRRAQAFELIGDDAAALRDYETILGTPGGKPRYALGGDLLGKYLMQRALIFARLNRFADAAADMMNAIAFGGQRSILRAQIYLRRNGFPDVQLDGRPSDSLGAALQSCFQLQACFSGLMRDS